MLILDDFGMRELIARQADDLYELIRGNGPAVHSCSPATAHPSTGIRCPNAVVAESLLDRLINTDGIRWRVRAGTPWRDVPFNYGSWQAIYGLSALATDRVWAAILALLRARADAVRLITWDVSVDSTIARAHQHAAGARRQTQTQKEPPVRGRSLKVPLLLFEHPQLR